jgi:hypothetical protein
MEAGTWELTIPLENADIVGSKWVFHAKKDAAGNMVCYKARLVAQGFSVRATSWKLYLRTATVRGVKHRAGLASHHTRASDTDKPNQCSDPQAAILAREIPRSC